MSLQKGQTNTGSFVKGIIPHNKGTQQTRVLRKLELFKEGLPIECKHHGLHLQWRLHTHNNVQCKLCVSETQKRRRQNFPIEAVLKDCKARKIGFDLDELYIQKLLEAQNNRCALSGIKFDKEKHKISIDRIDSGVGYIRGNIQLVIFEINRMKSDLNQERFIDLCRMVSETVSK